jgi:hypothetical protein
MTFNSLPFQESQFSKTWQHKAILRVKGDNRLSYSGIDEIPISHLPETEECWKVNWIRQNHLKIFKRLKMFLCFSCDSVPLKIQ